MTYSMWQNSVQPKKPQRTVQYGACSWHPG